MIKTIPKNMGIMTMITTYYQHYPGLYSAAAAHDEDDDGDADGDIGDDGSDDDDTEGVIKQAPLIIQ